MPQQIRLSQFVLTWGPGSILEGQRGPRIVPLPDTGLFRGDLQPEWFEISDRRMSLGLLGGHRIFRLPVNAELGWPSWKLVYRTHPFPRWRLCHNRQKHRWGMWESFSVLFAANQCPLCHSAQREHQEPVRFVQACSAGHLDDVNWPLVVHGGRQTCHHTKWFVWEGAGRGLQDITLKCPQCRTQINLGHAYGSSWPCTGRFPERETPETGPQRRECRRDARIVQRQASYLRIPEIRTLFSVTAPTRLHMLLEVPSIRDALTASPPSDRDKMKEMLFRLVSAGRIPERTAAEILDHPWPEIQEAIAQLHEPVPERYQSLLEEEFRAFTAASVHGIPPRLVRPTSPPVIEVNPDRVEYMKGPGGTRFRVVPVLRLRAVVVQIGYRREVNPREPADLVDVSFTSAVSRVRWYPGVELFGEGIFLMPDSDEGLMPPVRGTAAGAWMEAFRNSAASYPNMVFRDPGFPVELHPAFVWWHTLSHLLIRATSAEAGYPMASIRERVYLMLTDAGVHGGLLLYTVQPGSDGSMGGLISLAPVFRGLMEAALDMLHTCSGDPLCLENIFRSGMSTGAACYACLFLPETSCEHRNMWLDRRVVMDNLP